MRYTIDMRLNESFKVFDHQFQVALTKGVDAIAAEDFMEAWESASAWRQTAIIWLTRKLQKCIIDHPEQREAVLLNFANLVFRFFGRRYIALSFRCV